MSFGAVKIGKSSNRRVTLTNIGDNPFTINRVVLENRNGNAFQQSNDCGSGLAPGASCTITVVFKPNDRRKFNAFVKISDSAVNIPQTVIVVGTGIN
jgi:hypothetical protein